MTRAALLASAALLALPTIAHANENAFGVPGLYTDYDIRLSYLTDGEFDETFLSIDGTAQYTFEGTNFGVGKDTFLYGPIDELDNPIDYYNFYGFYDFSFGRVLFGETPSAIDLIEMDRRISIPELFDIQFNLFLLGSFANLLYAQDEQLYGLTYQGDYGALQAAASLHYSDDADEFLYALALRYAINQQYRILAGLEGVSEDGRDPRFWIGAGATYGDIDAEIMYRYGNTSFSGDTSALSADVYYAVPTIDNLTIGGSILNIDDGFDNETIFGVGVEYLINEYLGLEASVSGNADDDTYFALEAFLEF